MPPTRVKTPATTPRSSDLRLSEAARHLALPDGVVDSVFPRVERRLRRAGVEFDLWQRGFGMAALGLRGDGLYAASVGGVVASIPRQVGKTYTIGNLLIGLCLEIPGLRVVWTSHHGRTTTNTFRSMQGLVKRKQMRPFMAADVGHGSGVRTANGEQEIVFRNGSIIMFGAREFGFGRGMDAVDVIVFDEAQILGLKALEDMVPAANQARNRHKGLIFLLGTPPRPGDDGEAFTARRAEALTEPDGSMMFVEFSADPDADPMDREQWRQANPSYPHRTPEVSMLRMRKNIPDDDSWRREALGIWDELGATERVVEPGDWSACVASPDDAWPMAAIGLDMDLAGRLWVSPAAHSVESGVHVELLPYDPLAVNVDSAVQWLWERCRRRLPVVFPPDSGASVLEAPMRAKGMKVYRLNDREMCDASAGLARMVPERSLSHLEDDVLAACVAESSREDRKANGWKVGRVGDTSSAPLLAATCSAYGAVKWSKRRNVNRIERRAVVA